MMKKQHLLKSSKKAFTLLEILLSVVIIVIIFTYIYGSFSLSWTTTKKIQEVSKDVEKRDKIISLLYVDYIHKLDQAISTKKDEYDQLDLKTANSLHSLLEAYVKYRVVDYNGKNYLVRLEGKKQFTLEDEDEFFIDVILADVDYFKVVTSKENGADYIKIFIKSKNVKDIYFTWKSIQ